MIWFVFLYIENFIAIDVSKSCAYISSLKVLRLTDTSAADLQGDKGANVPPTSENWQILG